MQGEFVGVAVGDWQGGLPAADRAGNRKRAAQVRILDFAYAKSVEFRSGRRLFEVCVNRKFISNLLEKDRLVFLLSRNKLFAPGFGKPKHRETSQSGLLLVFCDFFSHSPRRDATSNFVKYS